MSEKDLDLTFGDDQVDENKNETEKKSNNENITPKTKSSTNINTDQVSVDGPLIIFYGPREIGKTSALFRLGKYLSSKYSVIPNPDFRVSEDYDNAIKTFNSIRDSNVKAPVATGYIDYLLLDINHRDRGRRIAQILEAPGEHYFDPEEPNKSYPRYLNEIFSANYRKIYVFFFDRGVKPEIKGHYSRRIENLLPSLRPKDKIIYIYNKADERPGFTKRNGTLNVKQFKDDLINDEHLRDIIRLLDLRRAGFVPFSSGTFQTDSNGNKTMAFSQEKYPKMLWDTISKWVKG